MIPSLQRDAAKFDGCGRGPPQPVVGELVTITYTVDYALPGGFDCSGCRLEGGDGFLEDGEGPTFADGRRLCLALRCVLFYPFHTAD